MNESKSLANKHCLHLSIILCSKHSISHCQSPFLMFRIITLFQSLKLRSHNLFHSISSNLFSLTILSLNYHFNYPQKTLVSEKTKMRVVRIELTTLGLWDPRSSNWAKLAVTCFQNNPILLLSLHFHLMFLWTRKSRFGTITSSII